MESEALRAEPQDQWKNRIAAREAAASLFIIRDLRRLRYRTLRALIFRMVANLGFRSAPPQALRYRRAPRAKANPTDDELDQSFLKCVGQLTVILEARDV